MSGRGGPTPEQRRDAIFRTEAFQAVRDGMLREDQIDEYVAAMRRSIYGQHMALSFALRDFGRALFSALPKPLRRLFRAPRGTS